jgi:thiamine-monophosphate kinase
MNEFELLAKVRKRLPPTGPKVLLGSGDDAAVTVPGGATATSVDAFVEGVHFRREWGTLAQVGRKAMACALSDLAAMGAWPGEAYAVVGVPGDLDEDGCLELVDGLVGLAGETGTALVGGDVTRAPVLTLAITVVGHATRAEKLIGRGGAEVGDVLVLSGELGGAAAGLLLMERPELAAAVPEQTAEHLRMKLLDPAPRLAAGRALATAQARAMIDLSDGLGGDARHLAAASGVGLQIDASALPLAKGVGEVAAAAGRDPLEFAATGGEDYELLAALPPRWNLEAIARVGDTKETTLTQVGEVVAGAGVEIRLPGGATLDPRGYDQLG